jgi:hypothetical protein
MDRIAAWLLAVTMGVGCFFLYRSAGEAAEKATQAEKKLSEALKTSVNAGLLVETRKMIFAEIDNQFSKVKQTSGFGWRADIEFVWSYPYKFGFQIPHNWQWNLQEIEPGVITVDVPPLIQVVDADVAINIGTVINRANGAHLTQMLEEMKIEARAMVKEREKYYLDNATIRDTARLAFGAFLQDILNKNTPKDRMPIRKVIVNILPAPHGPTDAEHQKVSSDSDAR